MSKMDTRWKRCTRCDSPYEGLGFDGCCYLCSEEYTRGKALASATENQYKKTAKEDSHG